MELLTTFLDRLPFFPSRGVGYPELLPSPTCQEPLDVSNNFTFELIDGIFSGESESTFAKAFLKKIYTDTLDRLRVESKSTLPSSLSRSAYCAFRKPVTNRSEGVRRMSRAFTGQASAERGRAFGTGWIASQPSAQGLTGRHPQPFRSCFFPAVSQSP